LGFVAGDQDDAWRLRDKLLQLSFVELLHRRIRRLISSLAQHVEAFLRAWSETISDNIRSEASAIEYTSDTVGLREVGVRKRS
jgi:DNA-binding IclR family transcriptional regulator